MYKKWTNWPKIQNLKNT